MIYSAIPNGLCYRCLPAYFQKSLFLSFEIYSVVLKENTELCVHTQRDILYIKSYARTMLI